MRAAKEEAMSVESATSSTATAPRTSRLPGLYARPLAERVRVVCAAAGVDGAIARHLLDGGGLPIELADRMSENVVAVHGLPFSVATNFVVNQREVLVPMAVEEPSVVAAAANAARLVRAGDGFTGEASPSVMTAQVQLDDVPSPADAAARLAAAEAELRALGDAAVPRLVARGGGCRALEVRIVDEALGLLVVHVDVDVGEAMGANLVDTVAEAIAPRVQAIAGGRLGLRILTNLPLRRMVRVGARVPIAALGDAALADGIARASRFAERDPFRAVTHNKGIMNGVDAAAVALGQDWRAIEAGAHAYAALGGAYRPLATWRVEGDALVGVLEMPLAVATVGGVSTVHPGVRAALAIVAPRDARELAVIVASAGLASNLAALRALAGEGIQRGHMRLHARKEAGTQCR
jgi:hydroxymethylglutaryl-CoA reductase